MNGQTRRSMIRRVLSGVTAACLAGADALSSEIRVQPAERKARIKQSVSRWCYQNSSLEELCAKGAAMGLKAIDLLKENEWEVPRRYGLICSMGYGGGGDIQSAVNQVENHAKIEEAFRKSLPRAAKLGVPNIITFSGNRNGMSDEGGMRNTIAGLNRVKRIAEDNGVTICLELLNSKVDHKGYMADHTAWGLRVVQSVNSPNVKLLYDIYHMQIMEGDLIRTIRENIQWLGHFHTGGVPGRHELDDTQEVQWAGVMRAIAEAKYTGYVAHEFIPTREPMRSLQDAIELCDV